MKKDSTNTFDGGLTYDLNPLTTPNNVLTDAVNATFITFNGDELAMQNDAGNAALDVHRDGFTPDEYDVAKDDITVGSPYTEGDEVHVDNVINTPDGDVITYYQNINSNRFGNPNFTNDTTTQWTLNAYVSISTIANVTANTIRLTFTTTPGIIYQKLDLLKGTEYQIFFHAALGSNINTPTYEVIHYDISGTQIGSAVTIAEGTLVYFTTPLPDLIGDPESTPVIQPAADYGYSKFICTTTSTTTGAGINDTIVIGLCTLYASGKQLNPNVNIVTLSGTTGTANISVVGGFTKLVTFASTLKTTADNFVTAFASTYLAEGITVTAGSTNTIIFTGTDTLATARITTVSGLSGVVTNDLALTGLDNTEVWFDTTKVALTPGFMPLAVKEYGGVLYIASGKKGINEGGDQIEFGSYPSPKAIEFNSAVTDTTDLDSTDPTEFAVDISIADGEPFNPGTYVGFALDGAVTGTQSHISHYDANEVWTKGIYKLGLYHKLESSTRDLTKEYSYLSNTGYWFDSTDPLYFFNSTYYKGKLFTRLEVEPIEYFTLDSSTLESDAVDYTWTLGFKYKTECLLEIYEILVEYDIDGVAQTDELFTPITWSADPDTTVENGKIITGLEITIANAITHVGKTLNYVITPHFVINSSTAVLDDSTTVAYTEQYIIRTNRVIPDVYELVDLAYGESQAELKDPTETVYEYADDVLTGSVTFIELILQDENGDPLDYLLADDPGNATGFRWDGVTSGEANLTTTLGTYNLDAEVPVAPDLTLAPATYSHLQRIADRIPGMTFQQKNEGSVNLTINYSTTILQGAISDGLQLIMTQDSYLTYLYNASHSILTHAVGNLTLYQQPLALWIDDIDVPVTGDIGYYGEGVYKIYAANNWNTNYAFPNATCVFRSPKGPIQIGWWPVIIDRQEDVFDTTWGVHDLEADATYNLAIMGYVQDCVITGLILPVSTPPATVGVSYGWSNNVKYWNPIYLRIPVNIEAPIATSINCTINGTVTYYLNGSLISTTAIPTNKACTFEVYTNTPVDFLDAATILSPAYDDILYDYYILRWDPRVFNAAFSASMRFASLMTDTSTGQLKEYYFEITNVNITTTVLDKSYYNLPNQTDYGMLSNGVVVKKTTVPRHYDPNPY